MELGAITSNIRSTIEKRQPSSLSIVAQKPLTSQDDRQSVQDRRI